MHMMLLSIQQNMRREKLGKSLKALCLVFLSQSLRSERVLELESKSWVERLRLLLLWFIFLVIHVLKLCLVCNIYKTLSLGVLLQLSRSYVACPVPKQDLFLVCITVNCIICLWKHLALCVV